MTKHSDLYISGPGPFGGGPGRSPEKADFLLLRLPSTARSVREGKHGGKKDSVRRAREAGSLPLLRQLVSRGSPQHRGRPGGFILVEAESRCSLDFSFLLAPVEVHYTPDTTHRS